MQKRRSFGRLDRIRITLAARQLFPRKRREDLEIVAFAVFVYFHGASYRAVAEILEDRVGKTTVSNWWHRLRLHVLYISETPRARGTGSSVVVVADETSVKIGGRDYVVWVSIDADTMQVIRVKVARYQQSLDCRDFLEETRHFVGGRMILIHDRGAWYKYQAERLGIPHHVVCGGVRSLIECWNRQFKHRIHRFWRRFPIQADELDVEAWVQSYAAVWNLRIGW